MELEKFKDYVKSKKKTDYKPFFNWLKPQMNLNKKELTFLGRGGSGVVFAIDKFRIMKFVSTSNNDIVGGINDLKMAKFLYENNIKNAIKVYQHGIIHVPERYIDNISLGYMSTAKKDKIGYIIQERLYSMDKFISKFEDVEEVFNRDIDGDYEYFYGIEFRDMLKEKYNMKIGKITSFMSFLVEICHQFNRKIINEILNTILEFYTKSQFNFIKEIVNVIKSLYEQGIKWRDVHPEQFGYNIKGKLKAFDLDDNTVFNTVNYSSKNTIKEHKSNK